MGALSEVEGVEGREVDAPQAEDGGLMCAASPVKGGRGCHCRVVGGGGLSCTWRVGR